MNSVRVQTYPLLPLPHPSPRLLLRCTNCSRTLPLSSHHFHPVSAPLAVSPCSGGRDGCKEGEGMAAFCGKECYWSYVLQVVEGEGAGRRSAKGASRALMEIRREESVGGEEREGREREKAEEGTSDAVFEYLVGNRAML